MRFEVTHVYFAQHCFFLPLPHTPVGIQNAAATSKKTKDPPTCIREMQVHKLWTKVYSQKGLTAMQMSCFIWLQLMSLVISECARLLIWIFCPESSSLSFSHCALTCEANIILMHAFVMRQIPLWQTWWPLFMPFAQNTNCDVLIGWS